MKGCLGALAVLVFTPVLIGVAIVVGMAAAVNADSCGAPASTTGGTAGAPGSSGTPAQVGFTVTGKVSTFGPPGEPAGTTATGVSDANPGISLHIPGTHFSDASNVALDNHWFQVTIEGHTATLKDIDLGPADGLNRALDVTGAGASQMGIDPASFPTDSMGSAEEVAGPGPSTSVPAASCGTTSPGGYANPIAHLTNIVPERIDMGVDYSGTGAIDAIGAGTIVGTAPSGWPGTAFILEHLTSGAYAGKWFYEAECITPTVNAGAIVQAGQQVGLVTACGSGIEIGWGTAQMGETLAASLNQQNPNGDPGGWSSAAGASASTLLKSLGAPPGVMQAGGPRGQMPPNYPPT